LVKPRHIGGVFVYTDFIEVWYNFFMLHIPSAKMVAAAIFLVVSVIGISNSALAQAPSPQSTVASVSSAAFTASSINSMSLQVRRMVFRFQM
jgi:hypothetical protein